MVLRLPSAMADAINAHLFSGDGEEHSVVVGAAMIETERGRRLLGRRIFPAADGVDYVSGENGHWMLTATFVRRCVLACADEGLVYLAAHNHAGSDRVAFSSIDMESHRHGYPALIDILDGKPAGALVFAERAVAGDIWTSANKNVALDHTVVVGVPQQVLYPVPPRPPVADPKYDRQVRLFGDRGQAILASQKVAIIGAGGAGSLINQYLARLGVGHILIVDDDRLDNSNYPRVVGASPSDVKPWYRSSLLARLLRWQPSNKVTIAERVAREANQGLRFEAVVGDVTDATVAQRLIDCDAIFLAADTMRARLVVNAICHQYLIPTWQVGAKVVSDSNGTIQDVFSVVRHLVPGQSCLWCNELIIPAKLAEEAASKEQRVAQSYVDEVPAPSVITLNAVASAHAVDQYLFMTLGLQQEKKDVHWLKFRPLTGDRAVEIPRRDPGCPECGGRLAAGGLKRLPVKDV